MNRRSMKTSAQLVRAASDLDESIAIDPQGMTCMAAPGVTFTELVPATGGVLRCTPDNEHRLIFQMIHGSFGAEFEVTRAGTRIRYHCRRRGSVTTMFEAEYEPTGPPHHAEMGALDA